MKDMTNNKKPNAATSALDTATAKNIAEHYEHAKAKHPYFADAMLYTNDTSHIKEILSIYRSDLNESIKKNYVWTLQILKCEIYEVYDAWSRGDTAQAVAECYDVIAVLLRMVDVLEWRQELGKPESAEEREGEK